MSERSRSFTWDDPAVLAEALTRRSGLEAMRAMAAGELAAPPIAAALGLRLVEVDQGRAVFEAEVGEHLYNAIGSAHAGFASTLLDSAMGCALHTTLPAGTGWTTLELKANFTRALTVRSGTLRCEGTVVHGGRRIATTEARLHDAAGRLCAHGLSTILIER
jgi:uncharacterized protein (TIGR00369 family)